jgi:hypothetical protein
MHSNLKDDETFMSLHVGVCIKSPGDVLVGCPAGAKLLTDSSSSSCVRSALLRLQAVG